MSPPDPRELAGITLGGRYRILEPIGHGTYGWVYRARQLSVDRDVAVKVLLWRAHEMPEAVRRFELEAEIIARLRHPNTLKLIDFGRTPEDRLYIVAEYLEGKSLRLALQRGPIGVSRTLVILRQVCDSLVEAHDKGIIHRDLKPENVFLEWVARREIVKVLDFGIARLLEHPKLTRTGEVMGTPAYLSPEQAAGRADPRSDLYSLGAIAYECLSGRPPFSSDSITHLLLKHLHEPPRRLAISPEIDALVMSLLAKDKEDRPGSAAELRDQIEALEARPAGGTSHAGADAGAKTSARAPPAAAAPPEFTTATDSTDLRPVPVTPAEVEAARARPSPPSIARRR